jgi:oligopeptide transport system ATP-binding protein
MDSKKQQGEALLKVRGLKQHFPFFGGFPFKKEIGKVRAVDGVDLDLYPGETLGLVGESGCGKSTTARSIIQLYQPTAGSIEFEGRQIVGLPKIELMKARREMQMVFQDPFASLNPRWTVGQIIAEPLEIYRSKGLLALEKWEIRDRVNHMMDVVGLNQNMINRYPHEFSGGQRQRIGIARSLALNPKLILADEPVSALDVSIQSQVLNLFKKLQKEMGLAYLFIAHDLAVIEYISDRIAVMYLGKIVEIARSEDLYQAPMHPYTQALLSAVPIPDPKIERSRKRITLPGDVPSPTVERRGCYFADRCAKRMDICTQKAPPKVEISPGHTVDCWLYDTVVKGKIKRDL